MPISLMLFFRTNRITSVLGPQSDAAQSWGSGAATNQGRGTRVLSLSSNGCLCIRWLMPLIFIPISFESAKTDPVYHPDAEQSRAST